MRWSKTTRTNEPVEWTERILSFLRELGLNSIKMYLFIISNRNPPIGVMTLSAKMHQSAAVIESSLNIRLKTTIIYLTPVSGGCLGLAGLGWAGLDLCVQPGLALHCELCSGLPPLCACSSTSGWGAPAYQENLLFVEAAAGQKTCTVTQACFQPPLAAQLLPSQWS